MARVASPHLFFLSRAEIAKIVMLGAAQAAILIAWIVAIWKAIDAAAAMGGDVYEVLPWLAALAVIAVANAIVRALEFSICEQIGFSVVRRLRMQIYGHMLGMAPRQIQHRSQGSLLLRLTGDLTMLRTWISRGIGRGSIGLIVTVAGLAAIAWLSPLMAVATALTFLIGAASSLTLGRRLRRFTAAVRRRRSVLTSNVDEQLHTLSVIQLFGRSAGEYTRLSRQNDIMTKALVREAQIRGRMRGVAAGAGWMAVVAAFATGVLALADGYITLGMLVAALAGVRHLGAPVRSVGLAHDYWRRASVSRGKILDFMSSATRPLSHPFHQRLRVRAGRITFDEASVKGALHAVSGSIRGGERVAIVGKSGAGKSTLLGLVARLVEPTSGEVLIDGSSLASSTLESCFRSIGMVSADLPLMRGTVRRNLTYRRPSASLEEIRQVAVLCGLVDWIDGLPNGLDSWITEGGKNLSAGERQRLGLARAMIGYPRILLLDEPTASLDGADKAVFREVLSRYPGTILLATHDLEEAQCMDTVWHLDDGRLVEVTDSRGLARRQAPRLESVRPAIY